MKNVILLLFLLFENASYVQAEADVDFQKQTASERMQSISRRVNSIQKTGLINTPREGDKHAVILSSKTRNPTDEAWSAIQLFLWRELSEVELIWWKCKNPHTRSLILTCLYEALNNPSESERKEFVATFRAWSNRFKETEANSRISEIDFVFGPDHKHELGKLADLRKLIKSVRVKSD